MNTVKFSQVRTRRQGVLFLAQVNVSGLVFDCEVGVGSTTSARLGEMQSQTRVELIHSFLDKGIDPSLVDSLVIIQ
jgi:hypothetical protein